MTVAKKQRLQFDFTEDAVEELDNDVAEMSAGSRAEVVRHALRYLRATRKAQRLGARVVHRYDDGHDEVVIFP